MGADDLEENYLLESDDEVRSEIDSETDEENIEEKKQDTNSKKRKLEESEEEESEDESEEGESEGESERESEEEESEEEEEEEEKEEENEEMKKKKKEEEEKKKVEEERKEKNKEKRKKRKEELKKKKKIRLEEQEKKKQEEWKQKSDSEVFWTALDRDNKITQIERDEINDSCFISSALSPEQRVNLSHLPDYIKQGYPNWRKNLAKPPKATDYHGQPSVLVISSSAIRSVDLIRALAGSFGQYAKVAKLFAKHMKVNIQTEYLKNNIVKIAVGTPNRLKKLAETESLNLGKLDVLLIDYTYKDSKNRNIFEMPEIRQDLLSFIRENCMNRIKEGTLKIALY